MPVDRLRENDNFVESLQTAAHSADFGLDHLPALLIRTIDEDRWQRRIVHALGDKEVTFARFADFATAKTPAGLGTSIEMLKRMCRDNPAALDALNRAMEGRQGERTDLHRDNIVSNRNEVVKRPVGTTADYALQKLREDAPALHARVLAGELSPHAAMVEAGFRRRTISIPADDPERLVRAIRKHYTPEEIAEVVEMLSGIDHFARRAG